MTTPRTSISFYDTSTMPTDEMLDAMRSARLGDDVYGEDPTVNELEALTAATLGMDASLFLPSGTMANLVAVLAQTRRGDEVVGESDAHLFSYEAGGLAMIAGCMPLLVDGTRGVLTPAQVEPRLRKSNDHYPRTALLAIENTHNRAGGAITPPDVMAGLRELCDKHALRLHVDGARIFNAAVALGLPVADLVREADSVCFCLSKGLSAPVGSMLAGSADLIREARRMRKVVGGSMRQAGVLAAAGIIALRSGVDQLARDHTMARYLAQELSSIALLDVESESVYTNIVLAGVERADVTVESLVSQLRLEFGIRVSAQPPSLVRLVTHRHIGEEEVAKVVNAITAIVQRET
jgi:threonine aldolase